MAPPAKKAKKSNDEPAMPSTVVFAARGLENDVRLRVFNTEFYVHSTMLKLHSAFFFKFLDSPDKTPPVTVAPGAFKYEWATKIDEDGSWSLADARSIEKCDTQFDKFKGDKGKELIAFEKLLKAIYGEDYKVLDVEELILMTDLADYYRALPALSKSLYRALYENTEFGVAGRKPELILKLLDASCKLRFPALFRECVVLLAGKWDNEQADLSGCDRNIQKLIIAARHGISNKIAKAHEEILRLSSEYPNLSKEIRRVKLETGLPEYYRDLHRGYVRYDEDCDYGDKTGLVECILQPLLENNLKFDGRDELAGSDCGFFLVYFLCATIDDEDLPWARTETDW